MLELRALAGGSGIGMFDCWPPSVRCAHSRRSVDKYSFMTSTWRSSIDSSCTRHSGALCCHFDVWMLMAGIGVISSAFPVALLLILPCGLNANAKPWWR